MSRYRHEYKYMLNSMQEQILICRAEGIMPRDGHVNNDGSYIIRSLYFDDLNDSCFFENESGTDPRSKFRIRYYNNDTEHIKLEKKSKMRGMTLKESCSLTKEECLLFMQGEIPSINVDMSEKKQQLLLEMRIRNMLPKIIVTYERIPFVYPAGNVRITFDRKLSSSTEIMHFLDGNYSVRPIMEMGNVIMEVKWDEILPAYIKDVMYMKNLQWSAFSKYCLCRKYHL